MIKIARLSLRMHAFWALQFYFAGTFLIAGCATPQPAAHVGEEHLVLLENEHVVLGVWPQAGGRIVVLRKPDGVNLLYSHPAQWAEPEKIPTPSSGGHFAAYNGHNIWVGPQGGWWTQQDLNKDRRDKKKVWPPDPFLTYGGYTIKEKSTTSITLVSPDSPVSGVRLTKTYRLRDDGTVHLAYTLANIRKTPVSWDIWSNTRVSGAQNSYVPMSSKNQAVRVEGKVPLQTMDGFLLTRGDTVIPSGEKGVGGKIFLHPAEGVIATFAHGICFLKRAAMPLQEKIHPDQAFVEIYQDVKSAAKDSLLEMEFHSEFKKIPAGGTLTFSETWALLPYAGDETPAAHVQFLKSQGIPVKK